MDRYSALLFNRNRGKESRVALTDQNGLRETSWRALWEMSCRVAAYAVREKRTGVIPVKMERGAEAVATILGLNLAGLGVAAIAADSPAERVRLIEAETENTAWTAEDYRRADAAALPFDGSAKAHDPAFVVFTSGSTGKPKGVILSNETVLASCRRLGERHYCYRADDVALQTASFAFVAILPDLITPLFYGVPLHILPDAARKDPALFTAYINTHKITVTFCVPKMLYLLGKMPSIRVLLAGGERLSRFAGDGYTLLNGYGLSETAGPSFFYRVTEPADNTSIGTPDEDFCYYLLDEDGNPADEGEICISGAIASGYYHLPELTAKLFTPNPFPHKAGHETLLHTGDIVRRLPDGNLLYLNRRDFMIKINGQRVEPGEAEAVFKASFAVQDAACIGFTEPGGRSYLCCYYVADTALDPETCRDVLRKKLPSYMIPSFFVRMERFPLTPNGKLDRKAFLPPQTDNAQSAYVAPVGETETLLCRAFEAALRLTAVGAEDDFLALGGDSILAMHVVRRMAGYPVHAGDILAARTPRAIAKRLAEKQAKTAEAAPVLRDAAPLTDSQMGIYLQCMLRPDSVMYNVATRLTLARNATMTAESVKRAIDAVLAAHGALYGALKLQGDDILLCRMPFPADGICTVTESDVALDTAEETAFVRPFALFTGPLCRAHAHLTPEKVALYLDFHHIVCDGTSLGALVAEIGDALAGKAVAPEDFDAFSVSDDDARTETEDVRHAAHEYFDALLAGNEIDSNLLFDRKPDENDFTVSRAEKTLCPAKLDAFLRRNALTESSFFMGVFGYVLAKMTGQSDSLFAVAESGRKNAAYDRTVSMFVRTLPVLCHLDETQPASALLCDVQAQFYRSVANDCISFGTLASEYGVGADVMFVYQSDMLAAVDSPAGRIDVATLPIADGFANLAVSVWKGEAGYTVSVDYRRTCYNQATIERFLSVFERVTEFFAADAVMKDIPLLGDSDAAVLAKLNATEREYEADKTIVDFFRRTVRKYPDKAAVVCRDKSYSYREADALTDRIAAYLHNKGIRRGDTVSVLIGRCEYMLLAGMGVLKAGAVYQPLDPSYPAERLAFMCRDADSKLLIADPALLSLLPDYAAPILTLDEIPALPDGSYDGTPRPEDGFVLLYTSGTTGLPKGCRLTHRNVTAFLAAFNTLFAMDESCVSGAFASYGFDAHICEIYPALTVGGTVHIVTDDIRLDLPALKDYFEAAGVTHTMMTTQIARQFAAEYPEVRHLRSILAGGEKLGAVVPPKTYTLTNGYGPTETTLMITSYPVKKFENDIPIGTALQNVKLYILDGYGRRMPIGVPGELVVFGPQVSAGYLNRPEKTAEVFVKNTVEPHTADYENGYKTGDVVRFTDGGLLEILGRRDQQVKIRGFRIELSEIETVIREFPGIEDATVIAVDDPAGGKCCHAYIVAKTKIDIAALNRFITERKPPYMVPSATMQIDAIPLTPNLKVDKRKLPPILADAPTASTVAKTAMTELEEKLSAILAEIVGHDRFSVETDFASAGITSITSIRLAVKIHKEFGVRITSKDILDGGTILSVENRIVSDLLNREKEEPAPVAADTPVPLTQSQLGVYLDSIAHGTDTYRVPLLLELDPGTDTAKLRDAIRRAVAAHPSLLATVSPDENGVALLRPAPALSFDVEEGEVASLAAAPTVFAFENKPLFRFRILHCAGKLYLLTEAHHILADGESMRILMRDIAAAMHGEAPAAEEYTVFDLARDEQKARGSAEFGTAKAYYDSVFAGISNDYLPCPDRFDAPSFGSCDAPILPARTAIAAFCRENGVSENILFCAAYAVTLARYTAHEDAFFATIHNGRGDPRTENLFAMTVKTLPFTVAVAAETTVKDFLHQTDERLKKLKKYDVFSFADAAAAYGIAADTMFIYQGDLLDGFPLGKPVTNDTPTAAKAAVSLEVLGEKDAFRLHCEYDAGKYSAAWADGFADAYATCVGELLTKKTLGDVDVCSEKALGRFAAFNDTAWPVVQRPAYRPFEEAVARHPDKTAVIAAGESLSYRELDAMANDLAASLVSLGIPAHSTVALLLDRTKEIYVAEFGVLKSANVFLCLSPEYPDERIRFITEDAAVKAVVTTHAVADARAALLARLELPVVYADDIDRRTTAPALGLPVAPDELAYMIYTSGSTGKPKGVTVTHRGLVNVSDPNPHNFETVKYCNAQTVATAVTAFTFDASILEGYFALVNDATVCIAGNEEIHSPEAFCRLCLENDVNTILATPSFFTNLTDYDGFAAVAKRLRTVLAGGEEFTSVLLKRLCALNPSLCILNGYGPSEATVTCSCKQLVCGERITIGTPLANTALYCVDRQNHILPMGALGELTVVGENVGRGYLNRDDLTKKAFITLCGKPSFKTGDLAVITHAGDVEFHGRIDNQVKIRGLRVELGEIENVMNTLPGMKSAVVLAKGTGENKYLAAYYTAERPIAADELIAHLSEKLAKYMVPRIFRQLDAMPMTANGKIDRKALPEVTPETECRGGTAARTETEAEICRLFASILEQKNVFADDNFFEIGGNSLAASRAVMQLKSKGYTLEYQTIFDNQTPAALAAFLDKTAAPDGERKTDFSDGDPTDAALREQLRYNSLPYADRTERTPLGDVVLTGAVGFLGIHVLRSLLESESGHVTCLVRRGRFPTPETRLDAISFYYFGTCLRENYPDRVTVLDADITSENLSAVFRGRAFDTIINCAALVKHYAADDSIEFVNVHGVENLIALAKEKNAKLIQISTTSVAGVHTEESYRKGVVLHENQLFLADDMNNKYLISKFRAERRMLDAIRDGLRGKIIRVGNLMGRACDGEFQINMGTNAFLNALKGFVALGKSPVSHATDPMEFTPIDCCADAIVALAGTNDCFTVFHANNRYVFDEMMLIRACTRCGLPIVPTDDTAYYAEYREKLGDPKVNKYLSALLTNDRPDVHAVDCDNRFTANVLYRLGFAWPFIDDAYLDKVIVALRDMGFFEREPS